MSTYTFRVVGYVCKSCRIDTCRKASNQLTSSLLSNTTKRANRSRTFVQIRAASTQIPQNAKYSIQPSTSPSRQDQPIDKLISSSNSEVPGTATSIHIQNPSDGFRRLRSEIHAISSSEHVPERVRILEILEQAYQCANLLVFGNAVAPDIAAQETQDSNGNVSLLSDLEEADSSPRPSRQERNVRSSGGRLSDTNSSITNRETNAAELCDIVYSLLKEPKVAIDEDVLSIYVRIICQLGHPQYLPEIFFLYANKPVPRPGTGPVQYVTTSPNTAKNAIPQSLSDVALDTAILQRDLPLAIAIIDTTVATRAFQRNKFLRKGSIPLAAVGSTPLVAWAGAEWVAQWQDTFDPAMSKAMTMMGAMAYIGTLGTVGFIALTTWNDHHDRVVWTPGTPLRQRWSREEERLYFDRIAVAWGFQRRQRRGEEMGEEWEALREILGERSMILDKSDLLEGMQ